jgi:uncharacterized membrane protein YphA (DoxX/SURF4 family)
MSVCSVMIIARKMSEYAVSGLIGVVILQGIGYGLVFDINFFLRNLSVMGGLLMVLSDSWVRRKFAPAGLPQLDEKDRKMYFQLAGRVLLIFLFIGFVFKGDWSIWRIIVSLVGLVACVMVVVGFKAKWSATILVLILSIFNLLVNNFWTVSVSDLEGYEQGADRIPASPTPPPQGFRQVRLFPDPFDRVSFPIFPLTSRKLTEAQRRSPPPSQHGSRPIQRGREEEGLLKQLEWFVSFTR